MSDLCLKPSNSIINSISTFGHKKSISRKILVLGDESIGKTSLLHVYARDHFPQVFEPTVVENHTIDVLVGDQIVELSLWDNVNFSRQDEVGKAGPSSYANAHVILLCFSIPSFDYIYFVGSKKRKEPRHFEAACPGLYSGPRLAEFGPETVQRRVSTGYFALTPDFPVIEHRGSRFSILALAYTRALTLLASGGPGKDFFALSTSAIREDRTTWTNITSLICEPKKLQYKFDNVAINSTMQPFRGGFFKSTCFVNPIHEDPADFCIFVNPTVNRGQGLVIIAPENELEQGVVDLDLSDDLPNLNTIEVVDMPEKGGKGAVASRNILVGEDVALMRPVVLLPLGQSVWKTRFGQSVRRQAIDHLPLHTRAAVARLHGEGTNTDEFISNLIDVNTFNSKLPTGYALGSLVVDASRLNHACRPNVIYRFDFGTQILKMKAFKPIAKGEELTISCKESIVIGFALDTEITKLFRSLPGHDHRGATRGPQKNFWF
ncbi:hypothetical protein PTTG_05537 [Puccinia triticina 1-1 BBBD Race 1]|uniref:SET domain-containing protein n=2 Tax=Puccinia triticina TaxID=208348 RepID=A0A180H017_PUCT1|nr:hypothetical protein PTTG_05537 [Puccinia triticina 1-1 BBBD Race 1]